MLPQRYSYLDHCVHDSENQHPYPYTPQEHDHPFDPAARDPNHRDSCASTFSYGSHPHTEQGSQINDQGPDLGRSESAASFPTNTGGTLTTVSSEDGHATPRADPEAEEEDRHPTPKVEVSYLPYYTTPNAPYIQHRDDHLEHHAIPHLVPLAEGSWEAMSDMREGSEASTAPRQHEAGDNEASRALPKEAGHTQGMQPYPQFDYGQTHQLREGLNRSNQHVSAAGYAGGSHFPRTRGLMDQTLDGRADFAPYSNELYPPVYGPGGGTRIPQFSRAPAVAREIFTNYCDYETPSGMRVVLPSQGSNHLDIQGQLVHPPPDVRSTERPFSANRVPLLLPDGQYNSPSHALPPHIPISYWQTLPYSLQSQPPTQPHPQSRSSPYHLWSRPNSSAFTALQSATISASQLAHVAGDRRAFNLVTPSGTGTSSGPAGGGRSAGLASSCAATDRPDAGDFAGPGPAPLWPQGGIFGSGSQSSIATTPDGSMTVDSVGHDGPVGRASVESLEQGGRNREVGEEEEDPDGFSSHADLNVTPFKKRKCYSCKKTPKPKDKKFTWRRSAIHPDKICCNACGIKEKTHNKPRRVQTGPTHANGHRDESGAPNSAAHSRPEVEAEAASPEMGVSLAASALALVADSGHGCSAADSDHSKEQYSETDKLLPSLQLVDPVLQSAQPQQAESAAQPGQAHRRSHASLPPLSTQMHMTQVPNPVLQYYHTYVPPEVLQHPSYPYVHTYGFGADPRLVPGAGSRGASPAVSSHSTATHQQAMEVIYTPAESEKSDTGSGARPQRPAKVRGSRMATHRKRGSKSMANVAGYLAGSGRSPFPPPNYPGSSLLTPAPTAIGQAFPTSLAYAQSQGVHSIPFVPSNSTSSPRASWHEHDPALVAHNFHTATQSVQPTNERGREQGSGFPYPHVLEQGQVSTYEQARAMHLQQKRQVAERQMSDAWVQGNGADSQAQVGKVGKIRSQVGRHRSSQPYAAGLLRHPVSKGTTQVNGTAEERSGQRQPPESTTSQSSLVGGHGTKQRLRLGHRNQPDLPTPTSPLSSASQLHPAPNSQSAISGLPAPPIVDQFHPQTQSLDPSRTLPLPVPRSFQHAHGGYMYGRGVLGGMWGPGSTEPTSFDLLAESKVREAQERGVDTSLWGVKGAVPPPPPPDEEDGIETTRK